MLSFNLKFEFVVPVFFQGDVVIVIDAAGKLAVCHAGRKDKWAIAISVWFKR